MKTNLTIFKKAIAMIALSCISYVSMAQSQTINGNLTVENNTSPHTYLKIEGGHVTGAPLSYAHLEISNYQFVAGNGYSGSPFGLSIYKDGDTDPSLFINNNGNVGIGATKTATNAAYKLSVNGAIRAKEIVCETGWADFVFEKNYQLMSLSELETYIQTNKHLPNIPSAAEIETNGVPLAEMESRLLQKIEEITLYVIEQNKSIEQLKKENEELQKENELIKQRLSESGN